jgi:hypothetical protein
MAVREVAFELECFEWADERLEVAGRWKGLGGRRLARPVLSVDTGSGRRKRLLALPGGHLGVAGDGWRASFDWPGDPGEIIGAELEVGGNVAVDLPLPDRRRRRRKRPAPDPGDEALRNEAVALRAQVERLRAELAGRERENMQLRAQLDEQPEDEPVAEAGAPTVEIERIARERQELTAELARLAGERDRTRSELSAEIERLQGERDAAGTELEQLRTAAQHAQEQIDHLRQAIADAAAEAEATRERQRADLAALQDELTAERAQVTRLSIELAERPPLPPPATVSARRAAAAAPAVEAAAPVAPGPAPPGTEDPTRPADAAASDPDATQPIPAVLQAASLPGVPDPPGPLRAGGRPATQPGIGTWVAGRLRAGSASAGVSADDAEDRAGRSPAELDNGVVTIENGAGDEPSDGSRSAAPVSLQALKSRLEQLFAGNGNAVSDDETATVRDELALPGPRRSASAARARAGATVAARRSQAEVWGLRIIALVLVAVLLIAFLLILTSIA